MEGKKKNKSKNKSEATFPQLEKSKQASSVSSSEQAKQEQMAEESASARRQQQHQTKETGALSGMQGKQQQKKEDHAWGGKQAQQQQKTQQGGRDRGQRKQDQMPQGGSSASQQQQHQTKEAGVLGGIQPKQEQRKQDDAWRGRHGQQEQRKEDGAWGGKQAQQQQITQQGGRDRGQRKQDQIPQGGASASQQQQHQTKEAAALSGMQPKQEQRKQDGAWGGRHGQQEQRKEDGAWGGKQAQQQQITQQGGRDRQQSQQQQLQHGGGNQQHSSMQAYQHSGSYQKYEKGPEQKPQDGNSRNQQSYRRNQQQQLTKELGGAENPVPFKEKSCNGIIRGTLGSPGTLEVNYLRLCLDSMPDEAYHYDVTITPDRPKKLLYKAFKQFADAAFPDKVLTFDGFKNCYALERLKNNIEETVNVENKSFKVCVKETDNCVVDLRTLRSYQSERIFDKPMRALQVLEVVLASSNHERGIRVGRSFFRRPLNAFSLDDGYEAWTGLYQAAILGEVPLLNVDIAHKSFPCESTLLEYLDKMNVDKATDLRNSNFAFRNISSFLKGINITYTPPAILAATPKYYKVLEIGPPASQKKFKLDDGKETTVEMYFKSRGYPLKYPNLNCINVGSSIRQISLPMELCSIPSDQLLNRKDGARQVEKMVRYAATSTNKRKQKIMELLTYFHHSSNSIIRSFGLSIGSNFIKVPSRLLPAPGLEYLHGQTVTTFKGAWRMDRMKFLICSKPKDGHKWCILYEQRGIKYDEIEMFKISVIKTAQALNMNMQSTAQIISYKFDQLESEIKNLAKDKYDLVFVVLSERGTPYSTIKKIAELKVGLLTQCIKAKTITRTIRDKSVFSNILLKINMKLNGTNHKIAKDEHSKLVSTIQNVMFLGADVTHPSPDQRHIPSVVGVVASHDVYGACYNIQYRLQRSTVENIEDMEAIACHHLQMYHKFQGKYPELIIYYRDGVSDGQFPIVEREEIRAIKRACSKMRCNPKMTCIIVVKRHHTRFFPLKQPDNERDFNNVQAGTVVDQYITHPNEVQFFMVSHQSIQGTARPTRYNVIMDESKFDINLLQKLTYNLCHLFPRCNRAVSYPAPAYLAHLVAFRGRVYLEGTNNFDKNLKREYDKRLIKPDFLNKNPMFFI